MNRAGAGERGSVLLVTLMAMAMVLALVSALGTVSLIDAQIAITYRDGLAARYAAEGALAWAVSELAAADNWDSVAAGNGRSSFTDGPPGVRMLADGTRVDLRTEGSGHLYLHGDFDTLRAGQPRSGFYVAVWVAEHDGAVGIEARAYGLRGVRRGVHARLGREGARKWIVSWREGL